MWNELLPSDHIKIVDSVKNWEDALDISCIPLLKKGLITNQYLYNMKKSVIDNGPYMVLTDYFALMHAKPGEGVNYECMSLLVTKEEVSMEGKPVKIFLVLAAKDNNSHLKSLQEIMSVFMDSSSYKVIMDGNYEEIIKLFN